MRLLTLASGQSAWRGYEYFEENKVLTSNKISDTEINGRVRGSANNRYEVFIDLKHVRKSKCNCPHANGKRIICKHMIALYFSVFPKEANRYYNEVIAFEEEEKKRQEELEHKIINYIGRLKKNELQNLILEMLFDGPEWQYDRFVHMHIE
jgi:uncharacterized Zn finger protein